MQQCNPPCPPHLCEQWWHHGMCALEQPKPATCSCKHSDAWRCAVEKRLTTVSCHCACHRAALGEHDE